MRTRTAAVMGVMRMQRHQTVKWEDMRALILFVTATVFGVSVLGWWYGSVVGLATVQIYMLLAALLLLNLGPMLLEVGCRRFDAFDAKHLFLVWFFVVFTLSSFSEICFGYFAKPDAAVQAPGLALEVRSLSAITAGLCAFLLGGYSRLGLRVSRKLPVIGGFSGIAAWFMGISGIMIGCVAFLRLIESGGGISEFLRNLGTWRTTGILGGIGYLVFPATTLLPTSALLLFLSSLPREGSRLTGLVLATALVAMMSWIPILIFGFRISLIPAILQLLAIWHYQVRPIALYKLLLLGAALFVALSFYGAIRDEGAGGIHSESIIESILFRTSGIDAVERVVRQNDKGEPHRGVLAPIKEALTILVPRAIWPEKPSTGGLLFDDIFFYDFYIHRGDDIEGLKSGISTTLIGEALWTGGFPMVVAGSFVLGVVATIANAWRERGGRIHIFLYAIFMGNFFIFVEAPQNALNNSIMLCAMALIFILGFELPASSKKTL